MEKTRLTVVINYIQGDKPLGQSTITVVVASKKIDLAVGKIAPIASAVSDAVKRVVEEKLGEM